MLRGYRLKEKETDAYCTVFNTGNRPVPMFLELAVICVTLPPFPVSYLHLLLEQIYSSYTLFPALLARCCSNCRSSVLFRGREARVPRSSAWETTAALSFLSFFYRARRRSRGKWEPLAATCDTWSFPRCSTAARPRTRVSGHVFHTVT